MLISLTGIIGLGKSTDTNILETLGYDIIDADKLARQALLVIKKCYKIIR